MPGSSQRRSPGPNRCDIADFDRINRAAQGGAQVPLAADFNREVIARFFRWFDRELDGREFVAGAQYSIADITALCVYDFAVSLVKVSVDPALIKVARWHATVSSRPSAIA